MEGTASNTGNKHTDLKYLRGLAKGSNAFIVQMLNIYIRQTPGALEQIENALKDKDWKALRATVHKLRPSVIFVGLTEIKKDISVLEDYAIEESHLDEIPALVDKITKVCTEAIPELKEKLEKLK
jgi:HPt (histidine-containing phosphotransfer) domain-containing protein